MAAEIGPYKDHMPTSAGADSPGRREDIALLTAPELVVSDDWKIYVCRYGDIGDADEPVIVHDRR